MYRALTTRSLFPRPRCWALLAGLILLAGNAWATWPATLGGIDEDAVIAVETSVGGDVFIAGYYKGEIEHNGGATTSRGLRDSFVARLGPSGNVKWFASGGGDLSVTEVKGMVLDDSNNVYIVGTFNDSVLFGGNQIFADGDVNGFLAKINGQGQWQWARVMQGNDTMVRAIDVVAVPGDSTVIPPVPDSVVVLGDYQCESRFVDPNDSSNTVELVTSSCSPGRSDLFLARYAANGKPIWVSDRGTDSSGLELARHLVIDDSLTLHVVFDGPGGSSQLALQDDFSGGLGNWSRSHPSRASVIDYGNLDFNPVPAFETPMLGLRESANSVSLSDPINTDNDSGVLISVQVYRGSSDSYYSASTTTTWLSGSISNCSSIVDGFDFWTRTWLNIFNNCNHIQRRRDTVLQVPNGVYSSRPNNQNEFLSLEYYDASGQWQELHQFPAGGTGGQQFDFTGEASFVLSAEDALHPEFQIRFRLNSGSGSSSLFVTSFRVTTYRAYWIAGNANSSLMDQYSTFTFLQPQSSFRQWTWWHVDSVRIERLPALRPQLMSVTNIMSASGPESNAFSQPVNLPQGVSVGAVVADSARNRLLIHGQRSSDIGAGFCGGLSGQPPGAFFAALHLNDYQCQSARFFSGGRAHGMTVDNSGNVYLTGSFLNQMVFSAADGIALNSTSSLDPASPSTSDIYIARLDRTDNLYTLAWATGGGEQDPDIGIPSFAGGTGNDAGLALATDGVSSLYVGGRFSGQARFGPTEIMIANGKSDAFVGTLGLTGLFFQEEGWLAGVALTPPPNAETSDVTLMPQFRVDGQDFDAIDEQIFYWAPPAAGGPARLIPLQPFGSIEVLWRVAGEDVTSDARIPQLGSVQWPTEPCTDDLGTGCYQVHVIGAPVEAEPGTGDFKVLQVINPATGSSDPSYSSGVFSADRSGTSAIIYVNGPTLDPQQFPVVVEIVRSLPFTAVPFFVDGVDAEIGQPITDPFHNEPNRTGFVVNELAYYDGYGSDAAYNRTARTGAIIPVNRYSSARPQDIGRELAVAWYRQNTKGVFWPGKVVRYAPHWPFDPDRIIIASELGGEVLGQQPINPLVFSNARIYVQNDFDKPGYNPNDEHAFMAPSATGSGFDAVFALRADFGSNLEGDQAAASDPYVLVKYFDNNVQQWRFRVYRVDATGAGFSEFRYSGTAGTTVAPPYPVSVLQGCAETFVEGQAVGEPAPPPFFQDYTAQLWAKSAGSGAVHYYYPAQPNFFTDLANNDDNEIGAGDCVPWLPRLPLEQGGSASSQEPIRVAYDIIWPELTPLLTIGETLLEPKRGLPDIINQAAVEVVYDEIQETVENALPSDVLATLIDPLNPRFVFLDEIPAEIATEMRSDGTRSILGSADGSIKLPVSIRDRIHYDPQNNRLILQGVYDPTGAGDPLLLLNVLSMRDRVILKTLDGGDGTEAIGFPSRCDTPDAGCSWAEAVEALFRLSRNPQGIEEICLSSFLNEQRERICQVSRPVNASDVLVGYQDDSGQGILTPFQAVGVNAALSAGAAQGTGYVTLAFNNDPGLTPLPVSLEIIRVGCLQSPPDQNPPDILSSYQGQINIIAPDNIFDEQLVLRHSGDFGGNPDALEFEWFYKPDTDGTPPLPVPDPESGQMHGWFQFAVDDPQGAVEITISGANILTLSDNWFLARYRGLPACGNDSNWSLYAGNPGATPINELAQLAEGWVKRVLGRLNPFEARVQDFAQAATNNYASMLIQLGERYEGPVALNNDPDNLNSLGLIEAYTTVMRRAMQLSIDGTPPVNYGPANTAILLVASRLVDFYTLLGNEAYADAQDPTIGITTNDGQFSLAPSIFKFQNQLASPLEEELVLLRGRDNTLGPVAASPVYNRLFWNFTGGDGEVAYVLGYNVTDQNDDGVIDEFDARIMFPQGHGDAWGHYLTATKIYYDLLRHPFFTWVPRPEAVVVAGVPITVSFLDERQFAETAAAKARAGAEIVDLTYRSKFVADPDGQWQGYEDVNPERAWGMSEWGRRSGMAAYFDWVTVNSIIPDIDNDPNLVGIQRIDRTTVPEIDEIRSHYMAIQGQVDKADAGLNPLGLATGVVPFDIDPSQVDAGKTQFEQILDRAMKAMENAIEVWDFANQLNNQIRRNQNTVDDLRRDSAATETDFANQLIEIFGYPYVDDIGPGGTYPAGYDGPDMYNYMLMDIPSLAGSAFDFDDDITSPLEVARFSEFTGAYEPAPNGINFFNMTPSPEDVQHISLEGVLCSLDPFSTGCALGNLDLDNNPENRLEVTYHTVESPFLGFWFTIPEEWTGQRRAPGQLQQIMQQMFQARIALQQALLEYEELRQQILDEIDGLQALYNLSAEQLQISNRERNVLLGLTVAVETMNAASIGARRIASFLDATFKNTSECVPKNTIAGVAAGGDLAAPARCTVVVGGSKVAFALDTVADLIDIGASATDASKEDVSNVAAIRSEIADARFELYNQSGVIEQMLRQEPILRAEVFARSEAIKQLVMDYEATLARGLRVFDQLVAFRRQGAAEIQEYRYQDMAFRIFRNDALQKYRASFDLAARYAYLAAAAYDYDTNLLGTDNQAGQKFLTDIVRQRNLGQVVGGTPISGATGLATTLAQLKLNFDVLKGQMGFNNPQVETNRFSLRREMMRIPDGAEGDERWRRRLEAARVGDLRSLQDFRRFARPFAPEAAGPQPGIVLEFSTNVTFGLNFFGWDLGPGDSSYDSSQFSTRIRSVGAWFADYAGLPLAETPRIYLFPVGADVLRAPAANDFTTREWQIVDQVVPVPFPISSQDLQRFDWLPIADTLNDSPIEIRRYARIPAHHFEEPFDASQVTTDSRLIGRSVWNRRWMIIVPGGTFLADPVEGLDTFIHGQPIPGGDGERDGQGVSDILIFFKTYSYPGS